MPTISKSARKNEESTRTKGWGFRNGVPFMDYTTTTAFPSNGPPTMDMKEKRRSQPDSGGDGNTKNWNHHHMWGAGVCPNEKHLWHPDERILERPPDVQDESPQATSSDPAIRKDAIDDTESTRNDLSELPKPTTYVDISTPVFTNPFGGNILFLPLPPLTQEDYAPLPDVFFQPGGYYKEPPPSLPPPDHEAPVLISTTPTTKQSTAAVPAKDISPFDTSNMTLGDQKLLRRVLFEETKRASRKRPSSPKRTLVLSYLRRRESGSGIPEGRGVVPVGCSSQNTNEETQEGSFRGFVRWAIPKGMAKWVLRG